MTRYRGIPLNSDRATFEAYERRVEDAALERHLREYYDEDGEPDEGEP